MIIVLYILALYIGLVLTWAVINLLGFFISLIFKSDKVIGTIAAIAYLISWIVNFFLGLSLLYLFIPIWDHFGIIGVVVYFLIGMSIIGTIMGSAVAIINVPFVGIPTYFADKFEKIKHEEDILDAEVIDDKGKVINKIESNKKITRRVAKYFLWFYLLNVIGIWMYPEYRIGYQWGDYIVMPALQIMFITIVVGFFYALFHKITNKTFFPKDRRIFFISVWKIAIIIIILFTFLVLYT